MSGVDERKGSFCCVRSQLKLQIKAKQSERGNALLGPLQWVGVHEQEGDEPSLMDLEYRVGEIEGRKLRIKREVRWLRKKLSEA